MSSLALWEVPPTCTRKRPCLLRKQYRRVRMEDRTPKSQYLRCLRDKATSSALHKGFDHSSTKAMPSPGGFPLPLSALFTGSSKIQEGNSSSALQALAAFPWGLIQRDHLSSGHRDCRGYILQSSCLVWHGLF